MAGRIAGITIEIGGETTKLQKSLKDVDSSLKGTQNNLKDINKLLKLDPGNTELLVQKQKNLKDAIGDTEKRLKELKEAQDGVQRGTAEWDALQREIIATEQNLNSLKDQYKDFGSVAKQQLQAVGDKMKETGSKISEVGEKMAGISGAAAAVGGALVKMGYDAMTGADDLNTLSKQTGISTDDLQKMQYASDLVDVSVESITGAMRKLKTKIDPSNESLAALGVSAVDASGNLRSTNDVFYDVLEALSQVENETERDQLAMELFGKSADELAGIIDDGGKALKEYGDQAEEMGLIIDEETLGTLNEANDLVDQTKAQLAATMSVIGSQVVPVLLPLLQKGAELIGKVTERLRQLNPATVETILKVVGIVAAIAPALIMIGKVVSAVGTVTKVIGALMSPMGLIVVAIAAVIAAGVLLYTHWDEVKQWATDLWASITERFNQIKDNVTTAIETAKQNVIDRWNNIKITVSNTVDAIKTSIATKFDAIKTKVQNVVDRLKEIVQGLKESWDEKVGYLKGIIEGLVEKFEWVKEKITGIVDSIKGIFNFEWELPEINLPIINRRRGAGGGTPISGAVPTPYASAYDNPVMFTSPTVLNTPNGLKQFGDGHGAEIVIGLNRLRELVADTSTGTTINVYPSAGMDERALAEKIQRVFVANAKQRRLMNA